MGLLRFLFSIATFILTMLLALFAFSYTAINYPSTMRELQAIALQMRNQLKDAYLPDNYMVWVDIFLQENQLVLVGFSVAVRIVLAIIGSIFGRRRASGAGASTASGSPFSRWG